MSGKYKPGKYRRLSVEQREKQKRFAAKWAKANHERRKIHMATHKLKHLARGDPSATGNELRRLWHRQRGRCALTGIPISFIEAHLDHIVATSKGGSQTVNNLRWTHPMANAAKGTKSDAEFGQWLKLVFQHRKGAVWTARET